jgi:hypothetical protein
MKVKVDRWKRNKLINKISELEEKRGKAKAHNRVYIFSYNIPIELSVFCGKENCNSLIEESLLYLFLEKEGIDYRTAEGRHEFLEENRKDDRAVQIMERIEKAVLKDDDQIKQYKYEGDYPFLKSKFRYKEIKDRIPLKDRQILKLNKLRRVAEDFNRIGIGYCDNESDATFCSRASYNRLIDENFRRLDFSSLDAVIDYPKPKPYMPWSFLAEKAEKED